MKELLEYIAKNLVSDPDAVFVDEIVTEDIITLKLTVSEDDISKVIGKKGHIARSIRYVMKVVSVNSNKKVLINIVS